MAGRVVHESDGTPVPGAAVTLVERATQATHQVATDADGRFACDDLPPGAYELKISAPGLLATTYQETIDAGQESAAVYRLLASAQASEEGEYGAVAVVAPPPREVSRRTLDRKLMYRIPGTGNDPIRAVEVLPGVARPPFGNGQLIIRGASPNDSLILVDGVPIPQLYHFGTRSFRARSAGSPARA